MRISDWISDVCSSDLLPDGMRWHYSVRAHGWSNTLHAWPGASAAEEGTSVTPTARIESDAQAGTVTFSLPARADRKSGGMGTNVSVRVDRGGRRVIKKNIKPRQTQLEITKYKK